MSDIWEQGALVAQRQDWEREQVEREEKDHAADCRACAAGEPMVHQYEAPLTFDDCLDNRGGEGDCEGAVEYRYPLSGTGRSFIRCDRHWEQRLEVQRGIDERYPDSPHAPSDFDPAYAGESWDGE